MDYRHEIICVVELILGFDKEVITWFLEAILDSLHFFFFLLSHSNSSGETKKWAEVKQVKTSHEFY